MDLGRSCCSRLLRLWPDLSQAIFRGGPSRAVRHYINTSSRLWHLALGITSDLSSSVVSMSAVCAARALEALDVAQGGLRERRRAAVGPIS